MTLIKHNQKGNSESIYRSFSFQGTYIWNLMVKNVNVDVSLIVFKKTSYHIYIYSCVYIYVYVYVCIMNKEQRTRKFIYYLFIESLMKMSSRLN